MRLTLLQGHRLVQLSEIIGALLLFSIVLVGLGLAGFSGAVRIVKERGSLTQF
jgi:hypothetical protein